MTSSEVDQSSQDSMHKNHTHFSLIVFFIVLSIISDNPA